MEKNKANNNHWCGGANEIDYENRNEKVGITNRELPVQLLVNLSLKPQ